MKLKVGDTVIIRSDLSTNHPTGPTKPSVAKEMLVYRGKKAVIEKIRSEDNWIKIDLDNRYYNWTEDMFESKIPSDKIVTQLTPDMHGSYVSCIIAGKFVDDARIEYFPGKTNTFFICQNIKNGSDSGTDKFGYKYTWCVDDGSKDGLKRNDVTKIVLETKGSLPKSTSYVEYPSPITKISLLPTKSFLKVDQS